jgi:hypothetical protein
METRQKKGKWLPPPRDYVDEMEGRAGITVVTAVDLYAKQYGLGLACMLREWIPNHRAFILSVSDVETLEDIVGRSMMNYLNAHSFLVDVTIKHTKPRKVT